LIFIKKMHLNGFLTQCGYYDGYQEYKYVSSDKVDTKTLQVKFDTWIFPFLNAYATVGWLDGNASIPLTIQGSDLMDSLGLAAQCDGGLRQPDLCVRTLSAEANPTYYGENFTLGINLAMFSTILSGSIIRE
jgi:hypothetical protein